MDSTNPGETTAPQESPQTRKAGSVAPFPQDPIAMRIFTTAFGMCHANKINNLRDTLTQGLHALPNAITSFFIFANSSRALRSKEDLKGRDLIMTAMNDGQHGVTMEELAQNELAGVGACTSAASRASLNWVSTCWFSWR